MGIGENFGIYRYERRIKDACCGDDDLIGRVSVEGARKLSGLDTNPWRKFDEPDSGIRKRLLKPIVWRAW